MAKAKKDKTPWGVFGVLLCIAGVTATIPLSLKGPPYIYFIIITAILVFIGVLLIAWAFSD